MMRTWIVRTLWTLGAVAVALLFVRTFVGGVYHVDSGSMEPTLWGAEGGGEWVFVRFTDAAPARQELVVAQRAGDDAPIVKRVLGLPGESVQVAGGDVLVDGRRLPNDAARPPWVVLYEQDGRAIDARFPLAAAQRMLWDAQPGTTRLDARPVARGETRGLFFLPHDVLQDDYLGPEGERVRGTVAASDARLECTATARDPGSQMRFGLFEQGDVFEAVVAPYSDGTCLISITRTVTPEASDGGPHAELLASARIAWPLDEARRVAFENRDNVVRFEVERAAPLVAGYRENAFHARDVQKEGRSFGSRVWFGGELGRFEFARLRLLRDLAYTDRGAYGVGAPCELGPDEYFLLGDHSSQSRDSREWGPVKAHEIVGRPVAAVWPPSRWRRLTSAESGS